MKSVVLTWPLVLAAPDSTVYSSSSSWYTLCSEPSYILHSLACNCVLQSKLARSGQAIASSPVAAYIEWAASSWQFKVSGFPLARGKVQSLDLHRMTLALHKT